KRLGRQHEAGKNVDLVMYDQLLRKSLCGIRRTGGILADERDLSAGDRIAVLLHVQLDAVVHLRPPGRKLAPGAHYQTDLQCLLGLRSTKAVAEQQTAETQNCLSHRLLPIVKAAALIPRSNYIRNGSFRRSSTIVMGSCPLYHRYVDRH